MYYCFIKNKIEFENIQKVFDMNLLQVKCEHLVIGSGIAGLTTAVHLARSGVKVTIISRREANRTATQLAQGGVACVTDEFDSFQEHINDTLNAGAFLCDEAVVRQIVEEGPDAVNDLIELGVKFTTRGDLGDANHQDEYDLGREGGHTKRRILHAGDITGAELEETLLNACRKMSNITFYENHCAIDLITTQKLGVKDKNRVIGAYILNLTDHKIYTFLSDSTTIATGGAGKVYLYSSNPDIACGAGIAMCFRAGVPIRNMEFFQFHPTILHHNKMTSFLISEAVRGEGAILKRYDAKGNLIPFMEKYHPMKDLAPRDIVARAIDSELKRSGQSCAWLDIRHQSRAFLMRRFPNIFAKCLEAGIDMSKDPIPVVPAAHYCCGGVKTLCNGFTSLDGLYVVGESASTGLHGANRLASNSLLEALVVGKLAARDILSKPHQDLSAIQVPLWHSGNATDSDEMVVITHNWNEIRAFMWDYVGIVRTSKRLERAKARIVNIRKEIEKYYWDFLITADLIELRNLAQIAEIIIDSAMIRKESRGLHFNADYPERNIEFDGVDTIVMCPN